MIGHGPSAGPLVGVLDRRPVSPLSSSRACSGAGSGWHDCGWIAVSAVPLLEGLAPWCRARARALCTGPSHRGGGSPVARGLACHGVARLSAACQLSASLWKRDLSVSGQVAVSPNRATGAPGQVGRKIEPGAAPGGHGQVTIQSAYWLALSRQVTLGRVASPPTTQATRTPRPGRRAVPDSGAGIGGPSSRSDHGPRPPGSRICSRCFVPV
jgi:hypothetical protein